MKKKLEVRSQRSEVRSQKSEIRSEKLEVSSPVMLCFQNQKDNFAKHSAEESFSFLNL